MAPASPELRLLSTLLDAAALELADLARLGDELEGMIARLAARLGPEDADLLAEAQAADLLSQRLVGVAGFMALLAALAPAEATVDAPAAVKGLLLSDQARRLSGTPPEAAAAVLSGELSLFGD